MKAGSHVRRCIRVAPLCGVLGDETLGRRDPARDWAGSCVRLLRGGRAERVAAPPAAAAAPPAAAAPHSGGPHSRSSPGPPPPPTPPPAPATPAAVAALRLRRHATLSRGVGGGREGLARQELEAMGQRPEARGQGWGRGLGARVRGQGCRTRRRPRAASAPYLPISPHISPYLPISPHQAAATRCECASLAAEKERRAQYKPSSFAARNRPSSQSSVRVKAA